MMDFDSANEEIDPLASSGISVSSYEDDGLGKKRRKSKSTLSRLRKLKKPEANGPIGRFSPHPPEKSAWNSPRTVPNGINHAPEEVDPFTGEVKKLRKKKDPFTSDIGDESPSPSKDDDDFQEKMDPFTGQIIRTKKKKDPFTSATSVDFEKEEERDVKVDSFTGAQVRTKKDPFTNMSSFDFDKPSNTGEEEDSPPTEIQRTLRVKRDPFTAMNSIDFNGTNDGEYQPAPDPAPDQDRTAKQRDPFTTMDSIEFNGTTGEEEQQPSPSRERTLKHRDPFTAMNSIDCGSPSSDDKLNDENSNVVRSSISDPAADGETGEPDGAMKERRLTPDGSDSVEGAFTDFEEPKVESSPGVDEVHLSDGNELLKSSSTELDEPETTPPPLFKQRRLSPLQEQFSQEQSSPERQDPSQDQSNMNIGEPKQFNRVTVVDEYGENIGKNVQVRGDLVGGNTKKFDDECTTEIRTTATEIEAAKSQVLEIDEESDSDDLVVMPGCNKKPPENENNSASRTELQVAATEAKNDDDLLPVATSTPAKEGVVSSRSDAPPAVPPLNLKGVVGSDDDDDETNEDKTPSAAKSIDSGHEEDEDDGSDSELKGTYTMKASTSVVSPNSGDSESEIIVRRKSRTNNIPDIITSPDNESSEEGSSNIPKKGKLSPIMPRKQPPPLEENFSSLVLRTCYKKDNLASSMVMSEPVMRSAEELSDTNRSYLSTGALPQISTKKVRNRSFLSGGVRNSGSLLGKDELERFFPDRKLRIFIATWNMCELKTLPDNLEDLLLPEHSDFDTLYDMYVIGTQESSSDGFEWEVSLQETLGPSHVLLHSATHGVLRLLIFIRRDLIWFCSPVEEDNVSTRAFSMIKTKGAIAASFTFFGTSLLFINAHFTSGDENLDDRLQDYEKICKNLQLPVKVSPNKKYQSLATDVTTRFDCVFWCGDFNFRLNESRQKVENWAKQLQDGTKSDYNILLEHDQLRKAMNKNEIFKGFKEGAIEFIPTYKFDIGDDTYDTSEKKRVPSYTDRILTKSRKKCDIAILDYTSIDGIKASDHRPVSGMFEVNIRPGKEDMGLGGGQFSREVFIEGNRRRAIRTGMSHKKHTQQDSSVCSVM